MLSFDQLRIPFRQSGTRYHLWMDADRILGVCLLALCCWLVFAVVRWETVVLALVSFGGGMLLLRYMAKKDPIMRQVYLRHVRYKSYYRAFSSPYARRQRWWGRRRAIT